MRELGRVCKPGARIVFAEPLGTNPLINLFRKATPALRVPTERPLRRRDIREIASHCQWLRLSYSECVSIAAYPLFVAGLGRAAELAHRALAAVDEACFNAVPPTRWLAWCVTIVGCLRDERDE